MDKHGLLNRFLFFGNLLQTNSTSLIAFGAWVVNSVFLAVEFILAFVFACAFNNHIYTYYFELVLNEMETTTMALPCRILCLDASAKRLHPWQHHLASFDSVKNHRLCDVVFRNFVAL